MSDVKGQKRSLNLSQSLRPGGSSTIRDVQANAWPFSALQPVKPVAPSSFRPRRMDFVPGTNIFWQPKSDDKTVIQDFHILRAFSRSLDLMRAVIETRKDQVTRVPWEIRVKSQPGETSKDRNK